MTAYYNENDAPTAAWLRELIRAGLIAPGDVDERSICDVRPEDLRGYTQHHFFAGIGGWSYALRLAGWPDDEPVTTGSCPCQPWSQAGQKQGAGDDRHLWPTWFRLLRQYRPPVVFGEQVEAAIGFGWLDLVSSDLEAEGYAIGAAVLGAASVGAPHIRKRLYWVADCTSLGRGEERENQGGSGDGVGKEGDAAGFGDGKQADWLADAECGSAERRGHDLAAAAEDAQSETRQRQRFRHDPGAGGATERLADAGCGCEPWGPRPASETRSRAFGDASGCGERGGVEYAAGEQARLPGFPRIRRGADGRCLDHALQPRLEGLGRDGDDGDEPGREHARADGPTAAAGVWGDLAWVQCRDGLARPVKPGLAPLAYGIPARVVRLRGYGNAIVPQVAAAFIRGFREAEK